MPSYEVLDSTAGGYEKVRYKGIDQIGYRDPSGDSTSQQAFAASKGQETRKNKQDESGRFTGEYERVDDSDEFDPDEFKDRRSGTVTNRAGGVEVPTGAWEFEDRLRGVTTDNITAADEWHVKEWGVELPDYPADTRTDELVALTENVERDDPHEGYRWGLRYIVLQDETEYVQEVDYDEREVRIAHSGSAVQEWREMSKLTTKMRDFEDKSLLILEFEERLEQLANVRDDYHEVLVYHTLFEGRNYA